MLNLYNLITSAGAHMASDPQSQNNVLYSDDSTIYNRLDSTYS